MVCPQGNFQFSEHLSGLLDSSPEFLQWNEQQKQQLGSIKKYQHLTQHRGKEENVAITENSSKSSGMQQQEPSKSTWGEIPSVPGASRVKGMKSLQINKHFFIHQAGTSNFLLKAAEPLCFRKWGERGSRGSSIPLEQHWGILFLYMEKSFGAGLGILFSLLMENAGTAGEILLELLLLAHCHFWAREISESQMGERRIRAGTLNPGNFEFSDTDPKGALLSTWGLKKTSKFEW